MAGLDIVQRSSMIVDNLDIGRSGRAARPFEADTPLHVDADAVLASAIGLQCFQPIAPECLQLIEAHRCVEDFQSAVSLPRKALELANETAVGLRPPHPTGERPRISCLCATRRDVITRKRRELPYSNSYLIPCGPWFKSCRKEALPRVASIAIIGRHHGNFW